MNDTEDRKPGRPPHDVDMALLNTTVERETLEEVRRYVKMHGMTLAGFVRRALRSELARMKKQEG